LFERKDNKKDALLDLDGRMVNLNKRYTAVKEAGVKIQAMVAVRRCQGSLERHLLFTEGRKRRQNYRVHKNSRQHLF
jgi:dynein heavy chain